MNPASKDIATIIQSYSGTEWILGTTMFVGKEPNSPDSCLTIYDTTNRPPIVGVSGSDGAYEFNGIQLRVRGVDYVVSFGKTNALLSLLNGLHGITIGTTLISSIQAVGSPEFIEFDNKNRPIWVLNLEIQRR